MEKTYLSMGTLIAPKRNPDQIWEVIGVYPRRGRTYVKLWQRRRTVEIELLDVQRDYTVVGKMQPWQHAEDRAEE